VALRSVGYRRQKLFHVPVITKLSETGPRWGFVKPADFDAIVN
jgi:hypothetical protein